jgi:cytolethal distending toxin subunit A
MNRHTSLPARLFASGLLLAASFPSVSLAQTSQGKLMNVQTGKCLTIAGGVSTDDNVTALQYDCDTHPSRTWRMNGVGSAFQIQNVQTGKCLTIAGGVSTDDNVTALQYNCDTHPSRTWNFQ